MLLEAKRTEKWCRFIPDLLDICNTLQTLIYSNYEHYVGLIWKLNSLKCLQVIYTYSFICSCIVVLVCRLRVCHTNCFPLIKEPKKKSLLLWSYMTFSKCGMYYLKWKPYIWKCHLLYNVAGKNLWYYAKKSRQVFGWPNGWPNQWLPVTVWLPTILNFLNLSIVC